MANTTTLLALIKEFPEPFLDPESVLPPALKAEEAVVKQGENQPVLDSEDEEIDWFEQCSTDLLDLQDEPELQKMAVSFLSSLSELAQRYQRFTNMTFAKSIADLPSISERLVSTQQVLPSVWDEPVSEFELPNLPETHARQGSGDCPSGMCPIDH
jgi:hypothetical protein